METIKKYAFIAIPILVVIIAYNLLKKNVPSIGKFLP